MTHVPVLLKTSVDGLAIHPGDVVIDATLGGGGHTEEIIKRYGDTVTVVGIDEDADAYMRTKSRIADLTHKFHFAQSNFRNIDTIVEGLEIKKIDRVLFDLGMSSFQLEVAGRGFSFQKDEPLLMTMKKEPTEGDITARDIVNEWEEKTLELIIRVYGEESYSRRIAHAIVAAREVAPIETTFQLRDIIMKATPKFYHFKKTHPATKTFQALRITVNDELQSLEEALQKSWALLSPGGRIVAISFHSLEDRIVKQFFGEKNIEGKAILITKKPVIATESEINENPRSRSAKLRIIEKK